MIKAIFIDIDGTLRSSNDEFSIRTKKAIQKLISLNTEVILTTGRGVLAAANVQNELGASPYIIGSNGGEIYDIKNNKTIYASSIPNDLVRKVYDYVNKNNLKLFINSSLIRYVNRKTDNNLEIEITEEVLNSVKASQLVISDSDFSKMKKAYDLFYNHSELQISNYSTSFINNKKKDSGNYFFDLTPRNQDINKGTAILKFMEYRNLDVSETISIGDGENDISMFSVTGISVAMGNASEFVKGKASYVTLDNDNDGVALVLENIIQNLVSKYEE